MKVFVAGASGAIGRPLVRQLVAAGHDVTGMTRREERAERIRASGARAVVCDALDPVALRDAVVEAAPEAVVNQLTNLPPRYDPRKASFFDSTNRLRSEGAHNLAAAARAARARRLVAQSIAFLYAPEGDRVKDEEARPFDDAPEPFGTAVRTLLDLEREAVGSAGVEGLVLRYGQLYGPGTYFDREGHFGREVRRRRFPIIGSGAGTFSFVHVEDAAAAAVAALDHGAPGVYNVVDDEPAALSEWLPFYAESLGARPPRRVPLWLARLVAGRATAEGALEMRGASNAKARRELGWVPRHASWREGFQEELSRRAPP